MRQKQQTKERNDDEKFSSLASLLLLSCFSLASLLLLCCFLHFFLLPSLLLRSFLFQIQLSSPLVLQRLLIFCLSLSLSHSGTTGFNDKLNQSPHDQDIEDFLANKDDHGLHCIKYKGTKLRGNKRRYKVTVKMSRPKKRAGLRLETLEQLPPSPVELAAQLSSLKLQMESLKSDYEQLKHRLQQQESRLLLAAGHDLPNGSTAAAAAAAQLPLVPAEAVVADPGLHQA